MHARMLPVCDDAFLFLVSYKPLAIKAGNYLITPEKHPGKTLSLGLLCLSRP